MKSSEICLEEEMVPKFAMQNGKIFCIDCMLYEQKIPLKDDVIYIDIIEFNVDKSWCGLIRCGTYNGCKVYGKGFLISKIDQKSGVNGRYNILDDQKITIPTNSVYSFEEYKVEVIARDHKRKIDSFNEKLKFNTLTEEDISLFKLLIESDQIIPSESYSKAWQRMEKLGLAYVSTENNSGTIKAVKPKNWMVILKLLKIEL